MKNKIINIEVLGSSCGNCKKLFELTKTAVSELGIDTEVKYINDIQKIISMGLMQMPVLTINGKVALTGSNFSVEKIKDLLKDEGVIEQGSKKALKEDKTDCCGSCNCKGKC